MIKGITIQSLKQFEDFFETNKLVIDTLWKKRQRRVQLFKNLYKMRVFYLTILLTIAFCATVSDAKQYMRCEMVKELVQKYKFDRTLLSNWVCMIEHESERDTTRVTKNANGSSRYGLFQISNKEWCKEGRKGGLCNSRCEDFLNDNLADDVECVKKVFKRDGFKHWPGWLGYCKQHSNLPNLNVVCRLNEIRK
ncbi:lysozyme-like isoform X3 [Eupeodes corollae]|uniref:lysozyme-like isoform X3 n=1 Tax=Eupeodes corollae TaxID=290404 RepID=UPI0024924F0E|nr:lysozyme-like isoform X3 [Eupeodes corollae]